MILSEFPFSPWDFFYLGISETINCLFQCLSNQGILKGEVSLYHWPPVWLVWSQLYDNRKIFVFYLQNRLIQTSQSGGQRYSDTSPFSILCSNIPDLSSSPERRRNDHPASAGWIQRLLSCPSGPTIHQSGQPHSQSDHHNSFPATSDSPE
jgi:hypothetical protein